AVQGAAPLTPIQRWFFEGEPAGSRHFNQHVLLAAGALDPALVRAAVAQLVEHHDQLRARFVRGEGGLQQIIEARTGDVPFAHVDLSHLPEERQREELSARAAAIQGGMDPEAGRVFQAAQLDLGAGRGCRLLLVSHHLVVDGVSWRILVEDLESLYEQLERGEAPKLPPKTTAFGRWAARLVERAGSAAMDEERDYWREGAAAAAAALPRDRAGGANTVESAQSITCSLGAAETGALLHDVPAAYRTEINDALLAALVRALERWTGSPRVRFDLEGHGREELFPDVDVTRTVGWFTTMFPVVVHLEGLSGAPGELLRAVKEQLRHVPRRGIGYGLLRYLCPDRAVVDRLAAAPRAEVAFNYLGQLDGLAGGGRFRVADEPAGAPHGPDGERSHLLSVNATVLGGQLHVTWEYSANVHDRSTIERVVADFTAALRAIIAHCRSPEAGGYTPSDFPLTGLTQAKIDQLFGNDRGVEDVYPLSPAQRGMLSHALFAPSELYFEQFRLRVGGQGAPFDPAACVRAWQDALERHPILRTSFRWAELDVPLQVVHRAARVPVTHIDLRGLPAPEQEAGIARALEEDRRRGFSLTEAPLLRVTLARTGDEAYEMLWSCHHLLLDGWSAALLLDELAAELAAASSGDRGAARPPRRRPSRDYIEWLARQPLDEAERFFRALLEGVKSPTPVWFDAAAHAAEDGFGEIELTLPDDVTARLRRLCQESELTLSTAVQGAWALLLGRRADRDDVVFGATVSGRPPQLEGVEAMLGLFINTLPLRVRIDDDEAVAAWLRGVQALGLRMRQHEHTPLLSVQQWSELPPGLRPFETLVVFENYPVAPAGGAGEGGAEASFFVGARTNYPLTLLVGPGARLSLRIVYQKRFFEPSTVARIGGELATILSAMSLDGGAKVGSLPVLTAEEQGLLASWNQTGHAPSDDDTLLGRQRAGGIGGAAFLDREVTAGELAASSALLAGRLADAGVLPGAVVAVALRDPIERIVASLAALRAGASFVVPEAAAGGGALDLGGAEVAATVTDPREGSGERWQIVGAQPGGHGSAAAAGGAGLDAVACHVRAPRQGGGAPAWVPLTHRALASYLAKLRAALRVGADDVLVCSELASAETAGLDVLLPLAAGARALVLSAAECGDREALTARIEASHATLLALPPDCFQGLLEQAWARAAGVRVLCARGLLPTELVMHLLRSGAEVWRIDVGHPAALWAKAVDAEFTRGVRYVGAPMTNGRAVVRDRRGRALPIGTIGELHVGDARGGAPPACADAPTGLAARALDTGDIELVHELARSRAALRPRPASSVEYIAPRDTVEFRLALALEELLQVHPIGIRDDFFALGGNSLLGLHLVAWIQRELGVHVPLAVLVEASTIEGLSDVLRRRGEGAARSPIVKIQPGGHLSPFFFVHPIGGNVLCYVDLARLMGADQPVYGLQAQGTDALDPRPPRIETMAAEYVDAVRRVQPRGPYLLGGLSFGGYVAFEMAQELHRRGEEVGMVALLDTWGPYYNESEEFAQDLIDATIIYGLASEFARSYGKSLQLSLDVLKRLGPEEQLTHVRSEMRAVNLLPRDSELSQMRRSLQWYRSNSRALRDYRPTVYDGQITLFRASEIDSRQHYIRYHPVKGDPTLGWGRLSTRSVELHDVPGTHTTMILDPMNLRGLAAKLRAALDQVHARIPRGDLQSAQAPSSGGALPEEVRR
ncbi:MAG: AMP-binding protein, partial [Polyangiaceae bacterium]|nr:AMP-binding protein [Polyangiaceae bacterium]